MSKRGFLLVNKVNSIFPDYEKILNSFYDHNFDHYDMKFSKVDFLSTPP